MTSTDSTHLRSTQHHCLSSLTTVGIAWIHLEPEQVILFLQLEVSGVQLEVPALQPGQLPPFLRLLPAAAAQAGLC